ncbi:DoxX family membrane protein [Halovulum dunhuangense]|uniref:DoxX family membrane protein n=1 Tax=Halovulum dunhuangense TaxID=1505036 RepID=A0A849L2E9_9RHOB|nr:DoxX family membrane protein [Halovulum dunhuangense]NNU80496.1 DoxX family membrane protein [Halovulum dunhuangense]
MDRAIDLVGRILIAALFLGGAAQKLSDPDPVRLLLAGWGLPGLLVWPAAALNAGLAAMLVIARDPKPWALLGAAYCGITSFFHLIPEDPWQMTIFVKNWAIAGGLMVLASRPAPGRWWSGR